MLLALPMAGVILAGYPVPRYLEFPPETRYIHHGTFSRLAFLLYSLFIGCSVLPLVIRGVRSLRRFMPLKPSVRPFPWWGWLGMASGILAWILAWGRFQWFAGFQPHTFFPLWISFIIVVNAAKYSRTGQCMMIDNTLFFILLFPLSASFWWFFEYLNRFTQNWYYLGVHYGAWKYFCLATLSFSTVLPAVLGVQDLLYSMRWIRDGYHGFPHINIKSLLPVAAVLIISGAGLACVGIWSDFLFPLLWISPLLILVPLQALMGERHVLSETTEGNWGFVVSCAAAALFCGIFWEMWNYHSLSKWEYSIPFVQRFKIFEMPILGYAGYLPFGLECAAIGEMLNKFRTR